MKSITLKELEIISQDLNSIKGSELQDVLVFEKALALGFWSCKEGKFWLLVDFNINTPVILFLKKLNRVRNQKKWPLSLFLETHFKSLKLSQSFLIKEKGRVLVLEFVNSSTIEFHLYLQGKNIIAKKENKQVSMYKPKDFEPQNLSQELGRESRSWEEIQSEWQVEIEKKSQKKRKKMKIEGPLFL